MVNRQKWRLTFEIIYYDLSRVMNSCVSSKPASESCLHRARFSITTCYRWNTFIFSKVAWYQSPQEFGREQFVEVWLIGSEGLVGAPVVLAASAAPLHRRTVQVKGDALRIKTSEFCELLERMPHLRSVVDRYLAVVLAQTSQSGACNSYHSLKQRLARWLLIARKATGEDEMPLTHGVLAELLGVRRASVTDCLEILQKDGTVTTQRGSVKIEAPIELSKLSCGCFELIEREYCRHLLLSRETAARPGLPASSVTRVGFGKAIGRD